MTSSNQLQLYWGRYKLNPTKVLDVEPATTPTAENSENQTKIKKISHENSNQRGTTSRRIMNDFIISVTADSDSIGHYPYAINDSQIFQKNFNFMYNVGLSPNKYDGKPISRTRNIYQQVIFWIFCSLSIIDAIKLTKEVSIGYVKRGYLDTYTFVSYMVLRTCIRVCFVYILVCNHGKIVKVLNTIASLKRLMTRAVSPDQRINCQEQWILGSIWSLNFVGSIVLSIFGYVSISSGWLLEAFIHEKSYEFGRDLFVWTSNSTEFQRITDTLWKEYANVTALSVFLALSHVILELYGRIYDSAATDVLLLAVIVMFKIVNDFKFEKVQSTQSKQNFDVVWMHFRQLQSISLNVDSAFGSRIRLIHLNNLVSCGYYLQMITTDVSMTVNTLLFTCHVVKVGLIYFLATKASSKNKAFRIWIQETYVEQPYITVGNKHLKTSVVLDELATKPIGIGSDNFHIDETFIMKFVGFVASYFMFLAQSKEKSSFNAS